MFKKYGLYVGMFTLFTMLSLVPLSTYAAGEKDTLIIGIQDNSMTLDPATHVQIVSIGLIGQMYETLVDFEKDDFTKPVSELAESWELGDDGKTWTFYLRKDAVFANGNPVRADDVVFSLHRVVKLGGDLSWMLTQFGVTEESITKIDEHTVQIVLDTQYAPGVFLACLAHAVASIVDQKVVMEHEEDGDMGKAWLANHSAGSGRFILEERKRGEFTILTANPNYWKKTTLIEKVVVKNVQEPIEQAIMLEKGEIDIAWDLQLAQVKRLETNPEVQIYNTPLLRINFVDLSLGYPPFAKSEVRDAIRYAIDYETIVDFVLQGAAVKTQTFIPKGMFGYNPAMPYHLDIEKAKQLLADAGYPEGFDVELTSLNYAPWNDVALQIKSDLSRIGVNVTLNEVSIDQLFEIVMSREFQMFLWEWSIDYPDPDAAAKPFAHSNSLGDDATVKTVAWVCKYVNLETSKLVEQAVRELDSRKRETLYKQISDIILDDGPTVILYTPIKQYGVRLETRDFVGIPSFLIGGFPVLR